MEKQTIRDVNSYIAQFPEEVQTRLNDIRNRIARILPDASEKISYQIPTFYRNGNVVHFAAFAHHVGLYPGAAAMAAFKDKLTGYQTGRGSVQFPLDRPMPFDLIEEIVRFCDEKNREKNRQR